MKICMKDYVGKGQLRNTDVQLDKPSHEKKEESCSFGSQFPFDITRPPTGVTLS